VPTTMAIAVVARPITVLLSNAWPKWFAQAGLEHGTEIVQGDVRRPTGVVSKRVAHVPERGHDHPVERQQATTGRSR